ncbi:hypothetical protein [Levilactobacillus tujiorum]|uniref:SLAP domain-containing protein n=1 Tax=Levilactobacillus tujiorum TaxID=2912243 RepID=A0ABX1L541_9LACO|nr:hypothetical protein [Levilactobacillus tujiorum]MCH5465174.1 hypothetical protein [Levilactobacillus tujiorum]NLR12202.1 hypothetical protein [Lactobacillus sp. HBUAS51387]NLR30165.1 hypothetical protein [Levilactobacillus tujiorum]
MKKIFGYVLGLVAALFAAGAIATTANADGSSADAASGSSSAASGAVAPAMGASDASGAGAMSAANSSSMAAPAKHARKHAKKLAKKRPMKRIAKKRIKRAKKLAAAKKMRGRYHYRKDNREILFQKGKKGAEVALFNRKGQEIKKFKVRKDGRFEIKLTKKQAAKLDKGGKYFRFDVHQKGYRPYEIRYYIYK